MNAIRLGVALTLWTVGFAPVRAPAQDTDRLVSRSLDWLAAHQDEDGRWDADEFMKHDLNGEPCDGEGSPVYDVGVTALALLCFLRDGHGPEYSTFASTVDRGLAWLRTQQDPESGRIGAGAHARAVIDHALATLALCEAEQITDSAKLRGRCTAAATYLEAVRNPYMVWRYAPRDNDNDTFTTGCCLLALDAARACGVQVDVVSFQLARAWFDEVTDSNRCGYQKRGELSARYSSEMLTKFPPEFVETLTAIALRCRPILGMADDAKAADAIELVLRKTPEWDVKRGSIDMCYWWFGTEALRSRPKAWRTWRKALDPIEESGRRDGNFTGSWDPSGAWGEYGGRVYSTAVMTLTWLAVREAEGCPIEDTEEFRAVRGAWMRGQFGLASTKLDELAETEDTPSRAVTRARNLLRRIVTRAEAELRTLLEPVDHLVAYERTQDLASRFKGLPVGDAARARRTAYSKDAALRRELDAARELVRARKKKGAARRKALARLAERYDGTRAAAAAKRGR